ncbi:GyrI-like domain-containing protein [Paenibacillus ferrarius]|uniref:GyrI-like domain-containing protein n=1 Tax=Paenibacillus ferrarius TaxID=1469647 RepID=UPI003D2B98E8
MNFEIVNLEQKTVVGVSAITGNTDPKLGEVIGGLWERFYQDGVHAAIKNKTNERTIGLYSDYSNDQYCATAGCEVSKLENEELTVKIIPAGKYAKFSIHGKVVNAVEAAWAQIWELDLNRSYTGDFEEYLNSDREHAEVDIYIALK